MLKRLTRIAITFAALAAGYLGYARGFAIVSDRVPTPEGVPIIEKQLELSYSAQEAKRLALQAFGPADWTIDAVIKYYDVHRGYYIYAQEWARLDEGKRIKLWPFAVVWCDRKGKAIKTLTSDDATLDFDKPLAAARGPGETSARIVRVELKGGIALRDDKGTPGELGDDLTITGPGGHPLNYLAFTEAENTIRTDQPILIRDRDTSATADAGIILTLRPKAAPEPGVMPGYDGAKSIEMLGHIWIYTHDVGRSGLVPGGAIRAVPQAANVAASALTEADAGTAAPAAKPKDGPRPGEITCDNGVTILLPPPPEPPPVGPPAPQGPTYATFLRNVRVRQGDAQEPEQIDGDRMDLTLVPARTPNRTVESDDGGPVSNLTLRKAKVTGHAVWLQSVAQHVVGKGNLLIYERGTPEAPGGRTFFRGAKEAEVWRENPAEGTVDVMHSFDITIFHDGPKGAVSSVVIGGPGWMQTRRKDDHVLLHAAAWQNRAVIQPIANDPTRRQLTLEGRPQVEDPLRGTLHASQAIVAILASKPGTEAAIEGGTVDAQVAKTRADDAEALAASGAPATVTPEDAAGRGPLMGGSYRIELLRAFRDAVLVSKGPIDGAGTPDDPAAQEPSTRTIHARDLLVVHFEEAPAPAVSVDPAADAEPEVAPPPPFGAVAAKPDPEPEAEPKPEGEAEVAQAEPKPADPPLNIEADTVWAWVVQEPADPSEEGKQKGSLREARLRDDVIIHQDKAPDGSKGFDVTGDRVDLVGRGEKLFEVRAYSDGGRVAKVATDTFSIEGNKLGLDQESNYAVAIGPGMLVQQNTGGNLLGDTLPGRDAGAEADKDKDEGQEKDKKPKGPMHISWGRDAQGRPIMDKDGRPIETWMKFYGITQGEDGAPAPAQAVFYNHVRGWTDDSLLLCGRLVADFDAPIDFRKARLAPGANGLSLNGDAPAGADPDAKADGMPKITEAHAHTVDGEDVRILVRRLDEKGRLLEKQYLHGKEAHYNKLTNSFEVPSPGVVYMYNHKKPRPEPGAKAADPDDLGPLQLTRVQFHQKMQGQLNTRQPGSKRTTGQAEFFGTVRVIEAEVPTEGADLSPDRPPPDFYYTVSDKLRVISEPPPPGSAEDEPDRVLVDSWNSPTGRGIFGQVGRAPSNVTAITADDRMTYDSSTGLAIIYGGPSGVHIAQQAGVGQDGQYGAGRAVLYNHKTGQHRLIDQRNIQLLNPGAGSRADSPDPSKKEKKKKEQRDPFPRVGPSDKERRNFTGR